MKSTRTEKGLSGMNVVYQGIRDSLFQEGPAEEKMIKTPKNLDELSYYISNEGIRNICYNAGFLYDSLDVSVQFNNEAGKDDALNLQIQDSLEDVEPTLTIDYVSSHYINDEEINGKIDYVIQRIQNTIDAVSKRGTCTLITID